MKAYVIRTIFGRKLHQTLDKDKAERMIINNRWCFFHRDELKLTVEDVKKCKEKKGEQN